MHYILISLADIILVISSFIIVFTYLGFPLFIYFLSKISAQAGYNPHKNLYNIPSLQVIVACYNEAERIEERLEDIFAQNYPSDRLSVLVISDGSTDHTATVVRKMQQRHAAVHLFELPDNLGKNQAINAAFSAGAFQADLLCFTDADGLFEAGALASAAKFFADPLVGLVGGKISYWLGEGAIQQTEGFFWQLENFLRQKEGDLGVLISCTGQFIQLRRELFCPLPDAVNTDFALPLMVLAQGYQSRFDQNAVVRSLFPADQEKVLKRRRRTIIRALTTIAHYRNQLPVQIRQVVFWHKTARFLVFPLQLAMLLSNIFLVVLTDWLIWSGLLGLQVLFYGIALLGWLAQLFQIPLPLVHLPYQFTLQNAVAFGAVIAYLRGERVAKWTPPR